MSAFTLMAIVAWHGRYHYFNWHPLLMTIGFVLCYMEGSLAYRVCPCAGSTCGAPTRKWIHGILQTVATVCGIAGTVCIFRFHDNTDQLSLYSLHSWIGLITVILFTFQFVMGVWFFGESDASDPSNVEKVASS